MFIRIRIYQDMLLITVCCYVCCYISIYPSKNNSENTILKVDVHIEDSVIESFARDLRIVRNLARTIVPIVLAKSLLPNLDSKIPGYCYGKRVS